MMLWLVPLKLDSDLTNIKSTRVKYISQISVNDYALSALRWNLALGEIFASWRENFLKIIIVIPHMYCLSIDHEFIASLFGAVLNACLVIKYWDTIHYQFIEVCSGNTVKQG